MSNFMDTKGQAQSARLEKYEFQPSENKFRIVGDILRRYVYWVRSPANRPVLLECLSFNRELEKFTNIETDHVVKYYPYALDNNGNPKPDSKKPDQFMRNSPSWAYVTTVIDRRDGKIKELHLKKTFFEEIKKVAMKKNPQTGEFFGDPTNMDTGWDIVITKEKTGPLPINVKYNVDAFAPLMNKIPLTDEEKMKVAEIPSVHERHPRMTPEEQLAFINEIQSGEFDKKFQKDDGGDKTPDDAAAMAAAREGISDI